ncbi:hypothetical protein ACFLRM_04435 [Acidobacteriota bacterium]
MKKKTIAECALPPYVSTLISLMPPRGILSIAGEKGEEIRLDGLRTRRLNPSEPKPTRFQV